MYKPYNEIEELDKDTLASDDDFIADAITFLEKRGNLKGEMTREDVYDNFMEHMRFHNVNEVTTIRDLEYAQNADAEGKKGFARLIDAYDKVDDSDTGRMLLDYAEGLATAPSTYIGLLTGMTGKAAAVAGTQAAKIGVRKALSSAGQSALRAAVPEGIIGAGQGAVQSATRKETGQEEEFDYSRPITGGIVSAIGGGAIAGAGSLLGSGVGKATGSNANALARSEAANELLEAARIGSAKRARVASAVTERTLKNADKAKVKKIKETLNSLDPAKVAEGRRLKQDLNPSSTLEAALGSDVINNIAAAAYRVMDTLNMKNDQRITEALFEKLQKGELEALGIDKILKEHNLNWDQFSLVYFAEISEAGRTLGIMGNLKKAMKREFGPFGTLKDPEMQGLDKLLDDLDGLSNSGISSVSRTEAEDIIGNGDKVAQYFRDIDKSGIGALTLQPATTIRNTIGGGFRIGVDAAARTMDNVIEMAITGSAIPMGQNKRHLLDGSFDVAKYMFNPQESQVVRTLFEETMPTEAKRLFRDAADLSAATSGESKLAKFGRKAQILNTTSDNIFKQAMLASSIKRRLSDKGIDLYDVIKNGEFGDIPDDIFKEAIKDSYEFTYQSGMRGNDIFSDLARGVIKGSDKYPFVISAFMPFPRFVANQLKFQYQHAPLIGMLDIVAGAAGVPGMLGKKSAKTALRERAPKQLAGALMLTAAYNWRVKQGDGAEWDEIHKGGNDYISAAAIYGPLSTFMVAADIIYRAQTGTMSKLPQEPFKYYSKAFLQASLGSTLRTGMGMAALDKMFSSDTSKTLEKNLAEGLGGFFGRWTIPFGSVKDLYGQFDPKSRLIPSTATGDENFFDYMYKKATRNLPDFPLSSWSAGMIEKDYDESAVSPTTTGPLIAINPLEKQLFGATTVRKSPLMQEMSRLGMNYTDTYRRDRDDKIDFYTRQVLSSRGGNYNLNEQLNKLINSETYKKASRSQQVKELKERSSVIVNDAKKVAKIRLTQQAKRRGLPYSRVDLASWNALSANEQNQINEIYQSYPGNEDRTVGNDKDLDFKIGNRKTNVMRWVSSEAIPFIRKREL
tara:strand:- start:1298 stop:4528 length:3231 start_codon:yes stop_codon:yes gene_type:complete